MEHTQQHNIYWKKDRTYIQPQHVLEDSRNMYTTTVFTGKDYGNVSIGKDGLSWDPWLQISNELLPLFIAFMC